MAFHRFSYLVICGSIRAMGAFKAIDHLPRPIRRGLFRLYIVVTVPWVLWFAYKLATARYPYRNVASDIGWMLLVPVGGPLLLLIGAWVFAGFRNSEQDAAPPPPPKNYEPVLSSAVARLADNNARARADLYERARRSLEKQLDGTLHHEAESRSLEQAIQKIELRESTPPKIKRPSLLLLFAALWFPGLWAQDFTSMSVYWAARLPANAK